MKRMTFFPGADEKLVAALQKRFHVAKEPGDRFSAELHGLKYSGPVRVEDGALRWYIEETAAVPQDAKRTAAIKAAIAKSEGKPAKAKPAAKPKAPAKAKPAPKKAKAAK